MKNYYSILTISAYPPSRSGGLVQDMMTALENEGHTVDFLTMYSFKGQKTNQYSIYPEPITGKMSRLKQRFPFLSIFRKIVKIFFKTPEEKMSFIMNHGYRIPHYNESEPPVDEKTLLKYLPDRKYDFIMIYITERMITTPSFVTIYNKYKVPLLVVCMDMLHFTGGCYFFGDCRRFSEGCGKCLVLDSADENDQTHKNYLIKADVYKKIQYAIICNSYMKEFALQSKLFDPSKIFTTSILIDEDVFIPQNVIRCRDYFRIPSYKKNIILSRYVPGMNRMKGYDHLLKIINLTYDRFTESERKESLLVLIGSDKDSFTQQFKIDTVCLGLLNLADLIKVYSAATVFISTSVDDAGPSMVNQSMMCGTPAVTFGIGTALDVTKEGINGYIAKNFDDEDFAEKIICLCKKSYTDYLRMRKQTRESALEMNSKAVNAKRIIDIFITLNNSVSME